MRASSCGSLALTARASEAHIGISAFFVRVFILSPRLFYLNESGFSIQGTTTYSDCVIIRPWKTISLSKDYLIVTFHTAPAHGAKTCIIVIYRIPSSNASSIGTSAFRSTDIFAVDSSNPSCGAFSLGVISLKPSTPQLG